MRRALIASCLLGVVCSDASGDTLELRDGTLVKGKYVGGTTTTVRLEMSEGVKVYATDDVLALTFTAAAATVAPGSATTAPALTTPAPAEEAVAVTVPAGTILTVRMDTPVSSKDPAGRKFSARLVADLTAGDVAVAKAGTSVYGQVEQAKQAGRLAGKSQLALTLTGVDIGGKVLPILTTNFAEAGKGEFRRTARNTAAGALIGAAVDDSKGAKVGATIGLGASVLRKGDSVAVPPGALLEFRLIQPVQVAQ